MNRKTSRHQQRAKRGSILVLTVIIVAFVVVPAGFLIDKYALLMAARSSYRGDVEAASLLAAEELSRIVVNDPHFGFISLSNYPPVGKATVAGDGEPCPVTSINTLLGTIRLDTIIANETGNSDLCAIADSDYEQAKKTIRLLQDSLNTATASESAAKWCDLNGGEVRVYADAEKLLAKNLRLNNGGNSVSIRNLRISLGWLKQGGTTNTPLPQPLAWEHLQDEFAQGGKYRSCINVPAFDRSFYFAAAARKPSLADDAMFSQPDGKRFCSAVKVEADIQAGGIFLTKTEQGQWMHVSACAVPPDNAQAGPTGALMVFFPCGTVSEVKCLDDLLHLPNGEEQPARLYQSVNGDLPLDPSATTQPVALEPWADQEITSSRVVSAGLYCWLRASGVRPRIDSTLAALHAEFSHSLKHSNLLYEFAPRGDVLISSLPGMPLPVSTLSDQQIFVETRGDSYSISCYNNVSKLGTIAGGKHAGQPLAGDPINWCDLAYFGLSTDSARSAGKGAATGLTAVCQTENHSQIPGGIRAQEAAFQNNGKATAFNPRKSYYSGGLAVELSISAI